MSFFVSLLIIYASCFVASRVGLTSPEGKRIPFGFVAITLAIAFSQLMALLNSVTYSIFVEDIYSDIFSSFIEYFGKFSLHSIIISLVIYLLIVRLAKPSRTFALAALSSIIGYLLNSAGLGLLVEEFLSIGFVDFDWFLSNLSNIVTWIGRPWVIFGAFFYGISSTFFLLSVFRTKGTQREAKTHLNLGGRAVAFKNSSNEPLRLIAGLAAVGRLPGQSMLEDEVNHPVQATPYPIDIDRNSILKLVKLRREENLRRSFLYTGIGIIGFFLTVGTESPLGIIVAVFAAMVLFFTTLQKDKYEIAPRFKPENFDESKIQSGGENDQNFVVYAGHDPFLSFGSVFGSWILSVDKSRPKANDSLNEGQVHVKNPSIPDIQKRICDSLYGSGLSEKNIKTLYFAQGKNLPYQVKQPGPHRPPSRLHTHHIEDFLSQSDSPVREYLWVRKVSWGHEISTSYFLRLLEEGDDINLEITGVLMAPIADSYRWIDRVSPRGFRQFMGDLFVSIFGGIALTVWSPIYLFILFQIGFSRIFIDPDKAIRRAVEQQPDYDFGAAAGLRRQLADFGVISYFQNSDRRMAETAFTGRILRAYIDALDDCHIDTSELREQRTTLLNQGIIVQGGDLKAKNVAAGLGAKISNVTSRMSGSRSGGSAE